MAMTVAGATQAPNTTQVYQLFIRATPEAIWEAITKPEFTARYFFGSSVEIEGDRYVGRGPDGDLWVEGAVLESDRPRRLAHEWRSLYDPEAAPEPASRVTYEIEPREGGYTKLTLVHDRLERSPKTAAGVADEGWMLVLSGLKTLLETGEELRA